MEATYSRDLEGIDQPVYDAAAERPGKPIRVRVQPSLFRVSKRREGATGDQIAWAKVSWIIECHTPEEVIALREAMKEFFEVISLVGAKEIRRRLKVAATVSDEAQLDTLLDRANPYLPR